MDVGRSPFGLAIMALSCDRRRTGHGRARGGFTLVELLVVVAILAVLIAILLPALQKAKQQALIVTCQARLHAQGIANNFHATDNRGRIAARPIKQSLFQIYKQGFEYQDSPRGWHGLGKLFFEGYFDAPEAMWCPANTSPALAFDHPQWGYRPIHQAMDYYGWGKANGYKWWMHHPYHQRRAIQKVDQDDYSGRSALFADGFSFDGDKYPTGHAVDSHHLTGYNVGTLDGSVRFQQDSEREVVYEMVTSGAWETTEEKIWVKHFDR
jgi:prepilin-type N-terminal cleavage/methylation domain-containing protein